MVAFLGTVGGGIWFLGKPPFANEEEVTLRIAGLQIQFDQGELDRTERLIFELRSKPRRTPFEEQELRRLENKRGF